MTGSGLSRGGMRTEGIPGEEERRSRGKSASSVSAGWGQNIHGQRLLQRERWWLDLWKDFSVAVSEVGGSSSLNRSFMYALDDVV